MVLLRYHPIKLKELLEWNIFAIVNIDLFSLTNRPSRIHLFIYTTEFNLALGIGAMVEEI